ncbi:MAG: glyoxylate/hydroxypyruvate reductase A [Steroidobacteraceae bacterium]
MLYKADVARGSAWARYFSENAPDLDFHVWPDCGALEQVEYLIAWAPGRELLAQMPRLRVIFSTGAGVDQIDFSAVPAAVPIVRMVEPGIINGMVEYVTWAVLSIHRRIRAYADLQAQQRWQELAGPTADKVCVGVMGLGSLGSAVLNRLATFGYQLAGWSRSRKSIAGVRCFAGKDELPGFLARCHVLVCLLPLTGETLGILNARLFAALPQGAALVNVGRGAQLEEQALLTALGSGQLSEAILDVASPEPLPAGHPFWRHPQITVTPHISSITQPLTAAAVVLENLRRHQRGEPLRDVVDRERGY